MVALASRIARLESAAGAGNCCPECGFDGDWSTVKVKTRISRVDAKSPRTPPDKYCGPCGRVVINVGWGHKRE